MAKKPTKKDQEKAPVVKTDIKDTKEALKLIFSLLKVLKVSKENDGKIDLMDMQNLMMAFPHVSPAIEGADTIVEEIKDLDEEEAKELLDFAMKEIGEALDKEELIVKIEKSLKAAVAIFEAVKAF